MKIRNQIIAVFAAACLCFPISLQPEIAYATEASAQFTYTHDPTIQLGVMEDIVVNPKAIYGFSPDPTSVRLGEYAKYDWTDAKVVADARQDRIAYHQSISEMSSLLDQLLSLGLSTEQIARSISEKRNEIRLASYKDDPAGLATVKKSNFEKYGNENGPTADSLFEKYGSWDIVLTKAFNLNIGMDVCLGLYDDYYDEYVKLGAIVDTNTILDELNEVNDLNNLLKNHKSVATTVSSAYDLFTVYQTADAVQCSDANDVVFLRVEKDDAYGIWTNDDGSISYFRDVNTADCSLFDLYSNYRDTYYWDGTEAITGVDISNGIITLYTFTTPDSTIAVYGADADLSFFEDFTAINYRYTILADTLEVTELQSFGLKADGSEEFIDSNKTVFDTESISVDDLYNRTHGYFRMVTIKKISNGKSYSVSLPQGTLAQIRQATAFAPVYIDPACKVEFENDNDHNKSIILYVK